MSSMKQEQVNENIEFTELIEKVSMRLVMNHINSCFQSYEVSNACKSILKESLWKDGKDLPRKVVVVVGAGASVPVLPMAKEAKEILKRKVNIDEHVINKTIHKLKLVYNLQDEFETTLFALSKFAEDEVRNQLKKMYCCKYPPLLQYEILAHLLKQRFIDAIINFNFDELLDQSIEDEFGSADYYKIISDGDCPNNFEKMGERCDLPVYIKPHGTASHKSSLRFTREEYYGLPTDISKFIKLLVTKLPVTLIVIGFSMKSFEFNHLLAENLSPDSEIFFINKNFVPIDIVELEKMRVGRLVVEKSLGSVMESIWKEMCDKFQANFYVRSIRRHEVTSNIFCHDIDSWLDSTLNTDNTCTLDKANQQGSCGISSNRDTEVQDDKVKTVEAISRRYRDPDWIKNYLRDRAIVELVLSIASTKGLVRINELADGLCGKYFSRYFEFTQSNISVVPILEYFGLVRLGYGGELYGFGEISGKKRPDKSAMILNKGEFVSIIEFLTDKTADFLTPAFQKAFNISKKLFKETLEIL